MKYSSNINTDYIVVGVSVLIITICSVLLYADYARKVEIGDAKQIGTITYKKKVAQRKYESQVIWEDLDQNVPVYNNDSIRTAELSEAIINLADGTRINIDENSLILLATTGKGINIDFSHGSISANRGDVEEGEASRINIKSKDAVVSLNKGDVKLSRTGEKELDVTVSEGKADIKTGGDVTTIQKDEKLTVTKDAGTKVVKLKLKLVSPPANDNVVTTAPAVPVVFTWVAVEGDTGVFLEIARDGSFTRGAVTRAAVKNAYTENLGEGSYYWRIRALNKDTNTSEYSDVRKISIIRDQPVGLIYPQNNDVISYSMKPPIINFRWLENKLASDYILEISRDPAFTRIERSVTTPLQDISVDRIDAGTYYWRVKTRNAGVSSYSGMSSAASFRIDRVAAMNPPVLILPPDGKRVSASMVGGTKNYLFSWSADSQVRQYDFMIGTDRELRNIVIRAKVNGNFYAIRESLEPKQYYWRVGVVSREGSEIFSASNSLLIVPVGSVNPGDPRIMDTVSAGPDEKRSTIRFPWTVSNFKGAGRVDVARDRGFLNIAGTVTGAENYGVIEGIPAGAYYWRVRLYDNDRSQIAESDIRQLFVSTAGEIVRSADEIVPKKSETAIAREEAEKKRQEEETRKREQEQLLKKEDELAQKKKQERARLQEEELARTKEEELVRKKQEEQARILEEQLEKKRLEETERKKQADFSRKQQEELAKKKLDELTRKKQKEPAGKENADKKKETAKEEKPVLIITSSARGSALYANSRLVGYDTVTMNPVPGERLLITVKANGFADYTQNIVLQSGEKKRIDARLVPGISEYREKRPGRRLRWRTNLTSTVMSRPVYRNNIIVATTKNGFLVGLNMNGGQIWRTALGGAARSTPAADDKAAYVVTVNSTLFSVDLRTGTVNWKKMIEGPLLFGSEPVVDKDRIFVATSYGMVQAFSRDGTEVWRQNLEEGIFSSMTCDGGVLYVGTDRSKIYAINSRDGSVKWSFSTDSRIFSSSPKVYQGVLFVGCYSGTFYAINRSGWLVWKFRAKKAILSAPTFFGDVVYFGSEDGIVYALKLRDGGKLWEFHTRGSIIAGPDVSQNSVLIPSGNAVFSIDVNSGELNWTEGFASGVNTPVTVVGNAAYVGLNNGDVVSLTSF